MRLRPYRRRLTNERPVLTSWSSGRRSKAVLLKLPSQGTGFEVKTPQAITAVRGTEWAVDVTPKRTSVFVVKGRVDVRRPDGDARASLTAGDGVDVEPGSGPLTVKRWPARRVSALMARFGQ